MIIPCAAIKFPLRLKELSACTKQPIILLFSCEGIDHASREMDNQQALRRYREHEHRTRPTSDRYLDLLG